MSLTQPGNIGPPRVTVTPSMVRAPRPDRSSPTVAVLGAGIMGSSVALFLARQNIGCVLVDAASAPFKGASRYNEGKIHLGYLYLADPSLKTAHKLIPPGLSFRRLVRELLDRPHDAQGFTNHNDTYLIHRDSVTDAKTAFALAERISQIALSHPESSDYFVSLSENRPRLLSPAELEARTDSREIIAGFEVPERSVSTRMLADEYVGALAACPLVEQVMEHRVHAVRQPSEGKSHWYVETVTSDGHADTLGPFDAVINALWEGRAEIDWSLGLCRSSTWTHRYRVSLFARTRKPVALKSAVIAVGPFGDIKNYDGYNFYLSWYESGLLVESHALRPPAPVVPNAEEQARIIEEKLAKLGNLVRGVVDLKSHFETVELRGGWVYAAGQGALSDPSSKLHRRDNIGLVTQGNYFSIDTGKYSTAPHIAREVALAVSQQLRK